MASADLIGLDVGGTKTAAVVLGRDGEVLAQSSAPTPAMLGPAAVLETAAGLLRGLGALTPTTTVGVGVAGVVDAHQGVVVSATDAMPGWAGTPVAQRLSMALGCRVVVDNDANAFAYGEALAGAAGPKDNVLAVTVGTGIGAGVVLGGRLVHGAHHTAGELGHVPAPDAEGARCPCGAEGHLEAVASGVAMQRRYAQAGGRPGLELPDIGRRATAGDPVAAKVIGRGARALGAVLGGMVNVLDVDVVVIGGGVVGLGSGYVDAVGEAYAAQLLPAVRHVPLVLSALGVNAVAIGAALLAADADSHPVVRAATMPV